jgi:Holliday junction resolvasome RuvABC endonuclease subunit
LKVASVDPGWSGAVVDAEVVSGSVTIQGVYRCPKTVEEIVQLVSSLAPEFAIMERVHSGMFHRVANFKLGQNYGIWCATMASMGVKLDTVSPQAWQKAHRPPRGSKEDIKVVIWTAMKKLYPDVLGEKYRPCESHTADALGILTYFLRNFLSFPV